MIYVLIVLLIVGVVLWMVNTYVPMENTVRQIMNVIVILCTLIWLLGAFRVIPPLRLG